MNYSLNLDKDRVSGMVLVDYRKEFNMVDDELLLRKLKVYSVANQELNWCRSYLCSRKQVVHVRGKESGEAKLRHGVPQGGIIGPLFFILFINDLPLHVSAYVALYADDRSLTASEDVKNLAHLDLARNKSVREIQAWVNANKLSINEDKTRVLTITGKRLKSKLNCELSVRTDSDNTLCNVESAALLGLEIDSNLSFNAHVDKICKKLASRIAVLRKIRAFLPLCQRVKYYNAVIRPVMSSASVIWSSCDKEQLYRVLKLQKRAARVILYTDRQACSVSLFNKLSWIPFYEQSRIDKCSIIYKRINWTLPIHLNDCIIINNNRHSRNTRYADINIVCPKYRRETEGGRTFSVSAAKLWNSVPFDIRKANSLF